MSDPAQLVETTIYDMCNKLLPAYKDMVVDIVQSPMSDEDLQKTVIFAKKQYYMGIFNLLEQSFTEEMKPRIAYALNNPRYLGLPSYMSLSYFGANGMTAGTLFAIIYFSLVGAPAKTNDLIRRMYDLDRKQNDLMESVWSDVISSTQRSAGTAKQEDSYYEDDIEEEDLDDLISGVSVVFSDIDSSEIGRAHV